MSRRKNVYDRLKHESLKQHLFAYQQGRGLYYWTQVIAFVGTDDFNKALIRYLEDCLCTIARGCCIAGQFIHALNRVSRATA